MLAQLIALFTRFAHIVLGISSPQSFPPPLKKDVEIEYFRLAAKGDEDARSKLILHNLRLVHSVEWREGFAKCCLWSMPAPCGCATTPARRCP